MTNPIYELHPGDDQDEDLKILLNQLSSAIDEVVAFGTHLLAWDMAEAAGGDENLPVEMIFRNIIENFDAIAILVRRGSIDPCKNLLRVCFESILNLEYMLTDDTRNRALAFLVTNAHKELKVSQKLTDGQQVYVQLKQKMQTDKTLPNDILPPKIADLDSHIITIKNMLGSPTYVHTEAEYQRIVTAGTPNPAWYQFYGGPKNLEQLSNGLNRQGIYEVLYRAWSGAVHGSDVLKGRIAKDADGFVGIYQIRHPEDIQMVTQYAHSLALILYRFFTEKRIPAHQQELDAWYLSIRQLFLRLHGPRVITFT